MMELRIHESPLEVAKVAASRVVELASAAEHRFTLGLAGGSTPRATYEALRHEPVPWSNVDAWLSDERWVPHDHPRCNGAMADEALTGMVPVMVHRPLWSERLEPEDSAVRYEAALRSIHDGRRPDLIMLGLGEDGHTASLFPGTPALAERRRWYVANHVPQQGETRLTATFPFLWSALVLMVLVVGRSKAEALASSLAGETPAGRLDEGDADIEWHVDAEAASLVS